MSGVLYCIAQVDLTGSSIFEYVHPSDHEDLREVLSIREQDEHNIDPSVCGVSGRHQREIDDLINYDNHATQTNNYAASNIYIDTYNSAQMHTELARSFCIRMRCILPKRNAGLVSSGYKVSS